MFFLKFRNLCFTSMMKTTQKTELLRRNGHAAHAVLMRSAISIPQGVNPFPQQQQCRSNVDFVERIVQLVAFDNFVSTSLLVWKGLKRQMDRQTAASVTSRGKNRSRRLVITERWLCAVMLQLCFSPVSQISLSSSMS